MVERSRQNVHGRILAALESDASWRDETEALCYHATRAKDWPKAFIYARSVARKCVGRSAFADATSHFEIAMGALDKTPLSHSREAEAVDLRMEARMAFMGSGRVAEWLHLGTEAERRADSIDDIGRKVAAMTVRAAAQNFYSTATEAISIGEQVVRLAEEWGDLGWRNLAEYGLGQAYFIGGRYREAEKILGRVCARLTGPEPSAPIGTTPKYLLLMCSMMKSLTHTALGEIDQADFFQKQTEKIADESSRPFDRVAASYSGGTLMLGRGNPEAAAMILDEAFELAREHSVRLFIPIIACQLGLAYLEQERIDSAREILSNAREAAQSVGYTSTVLRASIYLALALSRNGDVRTALKMLQDTRNTARQQGFGGLEAEALLCEAMNTPATSEDDWARIVRHLREVIAIATRNDAKPLLQKAESFLSKMLASAPDAGLQKGVRPN